MKTKIKKIAATIVGFVFFAGLSIPAFAQASDSGNSSNTGSSQSTKAERKAIRKQARAKKNAELKKLEGTGYKPAEGDVKYPQNLQDAEKKAGSSSGASQ
jgi:hypothetical protein